MSDRIDWSELFFSANGRIARTPFLIAAAVILVLFTLYESLMAGSNLLHWITGVPVYLLLGYVATCVLSKRFHDRGRSGWWAAPVLFAYALVMPYPTNFWDVLGMILLGWAFVECALMPSEQGANRFGPSPRRAPQGPGGV